MSLLHVFLERYADHTVPPGAEAEYGKTFYRDVVGLYMQTTAAAVRDQGPGYLRVLALTIF